MEQEFRSCWPQSSTFSNVKLEAEKSALGKETFLRKTAARLIPYKDHGARNIYFLLNG